MNHAFHLRYFRDRMETLPETFWPERIGKQFSKAQIMRQKKRYIQEPLRFTEWNQLKTESTDGKIISEQRPTKITIPFLLEIPLQNIFEEDRKGIYRLK